MAPTQPGGAFPPPRRYSLGGIATALSILFAIFIALDAAAAAAYLWRSSLYSRLSDGEAVSAGTADVADGLDLGYSTVWLLLWAATVVLFMIWQFRHARNANTLGVRGGLARPGWAIGGWFIPLANLVLPALQIYRSSGTRGVPPSSETTAVIVLWAIAFGLSNVIEGVASGVQAAAEAADDGLDLLAASEQFRAVGIVVELVAAVIALVMIRMLTKRQDAAFDAWVVAETPGSQEVKA